MSWGQASSQGWQERATGDGTNKEVGEVEAGDDGALWHHPSSDAAGRWQLLHRDQCKGSEHSSGRSLQSRGEANTIAYNTQRLAGC